MAQEIELHRLEGKERSIRGARDIVELWSELPAAAVYIPMQALPPGVDIHMLADFLRSQIWHGHCDRGDPEPCVDRGQPCAFAGTGRCHADVLIPVYPGGGAPRWRMASLRVQWRPRAANIRVLGLGAVACAHLPWAVAKLQGRFGLGSSHGSSVRRLGDMVPRSGRFWKAYAQRWLIRQGQAGHDIQSIAESVRHNLVMRAYKLSVFCSSYPVWQRIAGHLAVHVGESLLGRGLSIRGFTRDPAPVDFRLRGKSGDYDCIQSAVLEMDVAKDALPWLALLDIFGIGENIDKGFGQVELLADPD